MFKIRTPFCLAHQHKGNSSGDAFNVSACLAIMLLFWTLLGHAQTGHVGEAGSAGQSSGNIIWALEETFDGNPDAPSQSLLPASFDYVATHRTHPQEHFTKVFDPFLADHALDCTGPNPDISPLPQHLIDTSQSSDGSQPDKSFFICRNHMMSAMGQVGPYSSTAFWPRQAFDFSNGGILEFDVNINLGHGQRNWWEILITPREQLRVGSAGPSSAIDERYPRDRIVLDFNELIRHIRVGRDELDPNGWDVDERQFGQFDFLRWNNLHPDDPALTDRRIRRKMRISLNDDQIIWAIEMEDGNFDEFAVDLPNGLPFTQGLVLFKTHAYTPVQSAGNVDTYTFHWDNIRFDGPVTGRYQTYVADDVVYLQRNGNRPIGDTVTVNVELPAVGENPVLFGQLHQPLNGQVMLSVNGSPDVEVNPYDYPEQNCVSGQWRDWMSFRLPLNPELLVAGNNTLTWRVGDRPACAQGRGDWWDGFSAKFIQIQMDAAGDEDLLFLSGFESSF